MKSYETLRREGMSKQEAARIANTQASKLGSKARAYEEWSESDLHDRAQAVGIEGRSDMTKAELIAALRIGT